MPARILIVESDVLLAGNLSQILFGSSTLQAEVILVRTGAQARHVAATQEFDVAVVNVELSDGSGVELLRDLRKARPLGEVVLMTGVATVDSAVAALQGGAFGFLVTSFRPEELLFTVEQACAKVQLKREREELERRQRALIETAGVLIVAIDRRDCVALYNPKVAELTATGIPVNVGQPFLLNWTPEKDRDRMRFALHEARKGHRTIEVEVGFVEGFPPTHVRRVQWHLSAVQDGREQTDLVYGIGLDVTDRRALERRAAEAEALSAMGVLALGLAHEIRNPLNAAVLQLHLLTRTIDRLECPEKDSMRRRVSIVEAEIGRLERLLTEFLELARPRGVAVRQVNLGTLMHGVLDLEKDMLALQKISLACDIDPDINVRGDPEKLKQVLLNLLANARDALQQGGNLHVRVDGTEAPYVEILDNGPGIDPAVLQNVFDPFFTTKEAGTGLGLAIVRKIVDQHGGSVHLDSSPGHGTKVTVRLAPWEEKALPFIPNRVATGYRCNASSGVTNVRPRSRACATSSRAERAAGHGGAR